MCPQDAPVPAASWQSITVCPPRMSPSTLLPSKALLRVPMFPRDVPIGVAALQSTAACPPQAVPICVAFPQSTMSCPYVPPGCPQLCRFPAKHCCVCLGRALACTSQPAAAGHPWGDGPEPLTGPCSPPGYRERQKGMMRLQGGGRTGSSGITGSSLARVRVPSLAGPPDLGSPGWVHPWARGLHPGGSADGGCVWPRLRVGAAGCWGSIQHVPPMSPCQPEGPLSPAGRDPTGRASQGVLALSFF